MEVLVYCNLFAFLIRVCRPSVWLLSDDDDDRLASLEWSEMAQFEFAVNPNVWPD